MKYLRTYLFLGVIFMHAAMPAISIVYNFRIGQATRQPIAGQSRRKNSVVALIFDLYQKRYSGLRQNFAGGFASFIRAFNASYFRVDVAASHMQQSSLVPRATIAGTQTDDILFTLGRGFKITDKTTLTLSGLLGIPTHEMDSLPQISFGTGQKGTGIQLDGSYYFNEQNSIVGGARYIHFFPRELIGPACKEYTFTIGNIGDALFAYRYDKKKHGLEAGYTIRSLFGARITPTIADVAQQTDYLRSTFYAIYKYTFLINDTPNRLLFNISYGFDHDPKIYSNKYIVTVWGAWSVNF